MSDAPTVFAAPLVRFAPDVELVRGGDGRSVRGIIVPWDTVAMVSDRADGSDVYAEAFRSGAFDASLAGGAERVKFLGHHKRDQNPLGRATLLRADAAGQYGEFYVSKTAAGDEALELIRDGVLDAFSVGFAPDQHERVGDVVYRTAARLNEVSLVTFPAYDAARVVGVRGAPDLPTLLLPDVGAGEPTVTVDSGDLPGPEPRTGMTPNERDRAIALASLT